MKTTSPFNLVEKYAKEKAHSAVLEDENRKMKGEIILLQNRLRLAESSRKKKHRKRQGRRILKLVSINGKSPPNN